MHILRTDSTNIDFQKLIQSLDSTLAEHNGDKDDFFSQFNTIDTLKNCIVVYIDAIPAACGAFKPFSENSVEIKRMFTDPKFRKNGLGSTIVKELEKWAAELNFKKAVLETSQDLKSAISVYEKSGFYRIPNYGQYVGIEQSVCYEKIL
ncbi:GNAT family N-acetyltransferase [Chryseobacterium sp. JV558]|uniref:GNAT family N-acetyltransferase n=1 Tax=Chryseobacterium sp. JV558 TaxID=2663236 RepID=UPI00299F2A23|nr:GNAT family N-acetyltransferase [Chryseobacterium sp. JV558]MDW9382184.1 GNAT family N-acetyltransferase [Chryseobacterium sp. JV558]